MEPKDSLSDSQHPATGSYSQLQSSTCELRMHHSVVTQYLEITQGQICKGGHGQLGTAGTYFKILLHNLIGYYCLIMHLSPGTPLHRWILLHLKESIENSQTYATPDVLLAYMVIYIYEGILVRLNLSSLCYRWQHLDALFLIAIFNSHSRCCFQSMYSYKVNSRLLYLT